MARLVEKKGLLEQLDVYAALDAHGLSFQARIIGTGPMEQRLHRKISQCALEGRVAFETLLARLPDYALTDEPRWQASPWARAYAAVPIGFAAGAPSSGRSGAPSARGDAPRR